MVVLMILMMMIRKLWCFRKRKCDTMLFLLHCILH